MEEKAGANSNGVILCGWLTKQGGTYKSWRKRWWVLKEKELSYFKTEDAQDPLGTIDLTVCTAITACSAELKKPHSFSLTTPSRVYYFVADSVHDYDLWMDALHKRLDAFNTAVQANVVLTDVDAEGTAQPVRVIDKQLAPLSVDQCAAYGPAITGGVAGVETSFNIVAKDINGELRAGDDPFNVRIHGPPGTPPPQATVRNNGDGTYIVKFTPAAEGDHVIAVTVYGNNIPNSPFYALYTANLNPTPTPIATPAPIVEETLEVSTPKEERGRTPSSRESSHNTGLDFCRYLLSQETVA
eukprot:Colp12_sorted_trinity150504_noHs@35288